MNVTSCSYEAAVTDAARSGQWTKSLRAHVAGCTECSDLVRVAEWMGNVAARVAQTQSLPDPTYLWLRAQLEKRADQARAMPRSRVVALALSSLVIGSLAAAAVLAVLPAVSVTVSAAGDWLFAALAETPPALHHPHRNKLAGTSLPSRCDLSARSSTATLKLSTLGRRESRSGKPGLVATRISTIAARSATDRCE